MSHKKKGHLTTSSEWAKHLRKFWKISTGVVREKQKKRILKYD